MLQMSEKTCRRRRSPNG